MSPVTVQVSENVRDILLHRATINGDKVKLVGHLERKTYEEVNAVLSAIGGKWNRSAGAHVFKDPRGMEALNDVLAGKPIIDKKKTFQAFFTPDKVADQLVSYADLRRGLRVLEPSAGDGQLIRAARRDSDDLFVHAIDVNPDHFGALKEEANLVSIEDFLKTTPATIGTFDRVLMNPPFTNGQDVEHVVHAFRFVKVGGLLAAVVSQSFRFRTGKKFEALRLLVDSCGEVDVNVPAGAFKESGTNVSTSIMVLRK